MLFRQAADRLGGISEETSSRLTATRWNGPDAQRYRTEWQGVSARRITAIAEALRAAAAAIERNADEQRDASETANSVGSSRPLALGKPIDGSAWTATPSNVQGFRDFTNAAPFWPISNDTLLSTIPGVKDVLPYVSGTAILFDDRLGADEKLAEIGHLGYDTVAGGVRATAAQRLDPVGYLLGVAASQWGDVAYHGAKADFSHETIENARNYVVSDPGGAFDAAVTAVRDYVPKLVSNFTFW